jgi:hypothetical protein
MALKVANDPSKHKLASLNTTEYYLACGGAGQWGAGWRQVVGEREFSGLSER